MKADEIAATLYNCARITDMYGKAYQYLAHILLPPPLYPDNGVYCTQIEIYLIDAHFNAHFQIPQINPEKC